MPIARLARASALCLGLGVAALSLAACTVSITANDTAAPSDAGEPSIDASQSAAIADTLSNFCALEAKGALDFIAIAGADGVKDGIDQSIKNQKLTGPQADACVKAWVDTLKSYGYTYDPVANTISGSQTATPTPDDTSMPSDAANVPTDAAPSPTPAAS